MGCLSSRSAKVDKSLPKPPPTPDNRVNPVQEVVVEDEEKEDSSDFSDFVMGSENVKNDVVNVDKEPSSYPKATPIDDQSKLKRGTEVKWFSGWTAQMDDDVEDNVETDSHSQDRQTIRTQADVDRHARQAPATLNSSFADLINYLTGDLDQSERPEVFRARALMVWLSIQDVDSDHVKRKKGNTDTPEGYLTLLAQRRTTYSTFFLVLCREAHIKCTQIEGICKASSYQPGDSDPGKLTSVWNAIFVEQTWHIVHPYWICRCIVGKVAGGWIKLEAGGKTIGKKEEEAIGVMKNAFEEYYFMTSPAEFIYMCHPFKERWQLLDSTVTQKQFLYQAYVLPPFFGLGLVMKSEDACVYQAEEGEAKIKIEAPAKNANAIDMWYDFLLKEASNERKLEEGALVRLTESMPRLVAMIRCGEKWKIRIRFPVEGTYKLRLYGAPDKNPLLRLAVFRLDCTARRKECIPIPIDPKNIGFGPGPAVETSGLLFPSHRNGMYPLSKNKEMRFTFHLEEEASKSVQVKTDLITSRKAGDHYEQHFLTKSVKTVVNRIKRELSITFTIAKDGEYALTISTISTESSTSYRNVCNYLVSSDETANVENNYMRFAKNALRNVLADDVSTTSDQEAIQNIQKALDKCRKEHVSEDDEEVVSGKIRLEYLHFKIEIHDAKLRENWHVTEKTVRRLQQSRFAHTFRKKITELSRQRDRLALQRKEFEEN